MSPQDGDTLGPLGHKPIIQGRVHLRFLRGLGPLPGEALMGVGGIYKLAQIFFIPEEPSGGGLIYASLTADLGLGLAISDSRNAF